MLFREAFRSFRLWCALGAALASMCGASAAAQSSPSSKIATKRNLSAAAPAAAPTVTALPSGTSAVLADLAARAAVIFSGQVLAITPTAGVVDIRFHVDTPIRNCPQNGDYILREWAGLWMAHPDRYRVGQHVLLFLTARGPAGLSAPVDVNDGIVPLVATAQQPIANASGTAPPDTPSAGLSVDLRWLQTRVSRVSAAPVLLNSLNTANSNGDTWSGPVTPLAALPATSLASIITLIGTGGSSAKP